MMSPKRKISYEQGMALDLGRRTAIANARQRAHAKRDAEEAAARAEADRQKQLDEHIHSFTNWEYDLDAMTEARTCRICGASEARELRI